MALLSNNSEFNYRIWLIPVHFCEMLPKMASETHTVKPQFNEPLYNEVFSITNNIFQPSNSVMYGKEPQHNEPSIQRTNFSSPLELR